MTAVVLASILLTIPFMVAFIGIPLWMTFKRPQPGPDHSSAHAYLHTKDVFAAAAQRRQPTQASTLTRTVA
jgi:hypothetical protein